MLLLSAARLIPVKRQLEAFQVVKMMVAEDMDVKLICLSDGPYKSVLEKYIADNNLGANIFMLGAKRNIIDYMEASDLFLHLSESEASNNAVKEMGYCRKTAIVCNDVGDFDDYIENGVNGYIVDKANPIEPAFKILKELYGDQAKLSALGNNLYSTIIREFSIDNVAPLYDKLLTSK
jgi:glycosyltransferase involved in cell wall biosynthesis